SYNEKIQGEALADIIEENKKLNINYEDNAILYRTNIESKLTMYSGFDPLNEYIH
ncbi:ATP-dependent helicase, partial [human gut metagenome]